MLTLEKLLEDFKSGYKIQCYSGEERTAVTRLLADNGIPHGSSGWSEKFMINSNIKTDRWKTLYLASGIEYTSRPLRDERGYTYQEIAHILEPISTVQVDDLL